MAISAVVIVSISKAKLLKYRGRQSMSYCLLLLLDAIVSSAIQAKSALLVFVKESNLVSFHILLQEVVDGFGQ